MGKNHVVFLASYPMEPPSVFFNCPKISPIFSYFFEVCDLNFPGEQSFLTSNFRRKPIFRQEENIIS